MITTANVNDRQPLKDKTFHEKIFGKIFENKVYIGKDLFEKLFIDGTHLVTKGEKKYEDEKNGVYE